MTATALVFICAGLTVLSCAGLAYLFFNNEERAFAVTSHHIEQLPAVMAGRYAGFALLGIFFLWYQDFVVLMAYFAVSAFLGFMDAKIYRRAERSNLRHLLAGSLAALAAMVTAYALMTGGVS